MKKHFHISTAFLCLIAGLSFAPVNYANDFNLQRFDIDGARIGDSQNHFIRTMSAYFPASSKELKNASATSLVYTKPIRCLTGKSGLTRCQGKYAEMQKPVSGQQKKFNHYKDVVAEFNQNRELAFLSTITTTHHHNRKACLKELSQFYTKVSSNTDKPLIVYPRNQLDIYYIKIDEQPFATRMVGKLESAFSMVWQKERNDWSSFYSVDFGCRSSGHMVINTTLYDQAIKTGSSFKFQVSRLKTKD
jgi:hypothetical protein